MKVASFIPIKLNNQRLPGKNTLPLGKKPMCEYIFDTVSKVRGIDERYVYCSDEKIKGYMPDDLIFLQRDSYLDGFQVKGLEIIEYFLRDVQADHMETGAFYIFTREVFENYHQRIGKKPYIKVIDQIEAVDIDTASDYEFARAVAAFLGV